MRTTALRYLRTALGDPEAEFRDGQWESIESLLERKRMLVVQRTGWGKSMVYFLATRLFRDSDSGPTLLISPLLSLMRNQLEAASRIGITARTINSTNTDDWERIEGDLRDDRVDLLLISPERLANDSFRQNVLSHIAERVGLFVIDEAHCISDWGHDFRPDYRRIVRVLQAVPANVPILATTATANDRVVADVISQMGPGMELVRGPLVRESLKLQNISMPSSAARMAWLARTIPGLSGSGIIYTLTQRDTEKLAEWLQANGIEAKAYHAGIQDRGDGTSVREGLEQELLDNRIKVLVATVALGMGFDKPDLGFVIHYQRPASVVHYYQQVGRAGRAVDEAYGILLCGEEDDHIAEYFMRNAFPPQAHIDAILGALRRSDGGLSVPQLQGRLNLKKSQIDRTIKFLTVESPSPVVKVERKWHATPSSRDYTIDRGMIEEITGIREREQAQMQEYMNCDDCLMAFLERALDDPSPRDCGKCRNCAPDLLLSEEYDNDLAVRASFFLKRSYRKIEPRRRWPYYNPMEEDGFSGNIDESLRASEGRALCFWRDAGWGQMVARGKYETGSFDDELVAACTEMIAEWSPTPSPQWVTCIPSLSHRELVPGFARRLASALGLPFRPAVLKVRENRQQKTMENNFHQAKNLDGVFQIRHDQLLTGPCLLIDDMVDSRWTFTVTAALLRQAGCSAVYPIALALNNPRMN